jgi:predicted DNA-binding transcriptional regulator YafY
MSLTWDKIMSMNERIYIIDQMLTERRSVTIDQLLEKLEVSLATFKRDLALMRDRMKAPIIFDKEFRWLSIRKGE